MISRVPPQRVALVRPPVLQMKGTLSTHGAILPLGLAYVAAVLRDAGHPLQVIDAPGLAFGQRREEDSPVGPLVRTGLSAEEMVERLDPATDVIGITHMFLHEWPTVRRFAELTKARLPEVTIVVGGENATSFWKWIFAETDAVDYCVLGEGEESMRALLARLRQGRGNEPTAGVAIRTLGADQLVQTSPRGRDPDRLPRPAWELFPVENYLSRADNFGVHRGRTMPMLATRGCPYRCTFCSSPSMWTTRYVTRDPADVVDEIREYVERFAVDNIDFCDLTAIVHKKWVVEFCGLLEQSGLRLTWQLPGGTRSEALDEEVLGLLHRTGCRNITYAPESGSPRMLEQMRKMVKLPRMLDCLRAARRVGIVTRVNIIIGHPEERPGDLGRSCLFLLRAALAGCQDAAVMIFSPYPGSQDFGRLLERGELEIGEEFQYLALARSGLSSRTYSSFLGTRRLVIAQYLMLALFYLVAYIGRPWRLLGLVRSFFTGRETTQMDQLLRNRFKPGRSTAAAVEADPLAGAAVSESVVSAGPEPERTVELVKNAR